QVERARQRAGSQEALVELEVLVAADALGRGELVALADHQDLVRSVDDDDLHLAAGDLVDADEIDPPHGRARGKRLTPRMRRSSSAHRRPTSPRAARAACPGRTR